MENGTPFQIMLKSIKVIENGTLEQEDGVNGFVATLYHPTVGKTSVVTTRELNLRDNEVKTFDNEHYPSRILFKENILSDAYIEIELTSIRKSTFLHELFYKITTSVTNQMVGKIPVPPILTGLVKNSTESLFEIIKPEDKIEIIGKVGWFISENSDEGELPLTLSVPKKIVLKKKTVNGDEIKYVTKTINKGFNNALVVLNLKKLR